MKKHDEIQLDYYNNQAADYGADIFRRGLTRTYARKAKIINSCILDLPKPARILEIGAGSGFMTYFLSEIFKGEYIALDISSEMLKIAESTIQSENVRFVLGDGECPDFAPGYFNAVVGVDIIHHLENPTLAMTNWKSLVCPGGKMVFMETNPYNPLNLANIGVEHEIRSWLNTPQNLTKWGELAGWETVSVLPSPSFTPSNPRVFQPIYNTIDKIAVKIPILNKLTALWLINNTKKGN